MSDFNYIEYLKNNPLLKMDLNDQLINENMDNTKMKKSELKSKIRETILSTLEEESQYQDSLYTEAEEDVDVDVDVEDEVSVDAEGDNIDIEKRAVNTTVEVGLSPEEEVIQDSLKAAMDAANALGNDKLADQIGNTITFFTREYVVNRNDN
jgi:urease accessory protein UreE